MDLLIYTFIRRRLVFLIGVFDYWFICPVFHSCFSIYGLFSVSLTASFNRHHRFLEIAGSIFYCWSIRTLHTKCSMECLREVSSQILFVLWFVVLYGSRFKFKRHWHLLFFFIKPGYWFSVSLGSRFGMMMLFRDQLNHLNVPNIGFKICLLLSHYLVIGSSSLLKVPPPPSKFSWYTVSRF